MGKLKDAIQMFKEAQELKEAIDVIVPVVYPYIERTSDGIVDLKIRTIGRYEDAGFTRDEAILMTLNTNHSIIEVLKDIRESK